MAALQRSDFYEWLGDIQITEYRLMMDIYTSIVNDTRVTKIEVFIKFKNPNDALLYKLAAHNTDLGY